MPESDLMSAGKLAQEWGVSPKAIKDAITKAGVKPDTKKGACSYYNAKTAAIIKAALKS